MPAGDQRGQVVDALVGLGWNVRAAEDAVAGVLPDPAVTIGPDDVAAHLLRVVERNRAESFVPRWYRMFAIAQALSPSLVARLASRSGYRRG